MEIFKILILKNTQMMSVFELIGETIINSFESDYTYFERVQLICNEIYTKSTTVEVLQQQ